MLKLMHNESKQSLQAAFFILTWRNLPPWSIHLVFFVCLWLQVSGLAAQQNVYFVSLGEPELDLRETRMLNPVVFFEVKTDTIWSYAVEHIQESKPIRIIKPPGFAQYAYGYTYFNGVPNIHSPGMTNLLLCNYALSSPQLFVDHNNNADFTDDGDPINVPPPFYHSQPATIRLCRPTPEDGCIEIRLSRMQLQAKKSYRDMLNEYYQTHYPNRIFIGIDYCFREQRAYIRSGIFRSSTDSFRIALMDANSNGLYNEAGIDKCLIGNWIDTTFDSQNELFTYVLPKEKESLFFDKNGCTYQIVSMASSGAHITLSATEPDTTFGIPKGKKAPNCAFYEWNETKHKLRSFRKKEVYIYFTSLHARDFADDTTALRIIADQYANRIQVIAFIDVDKSYELSIFGQYANINWIAAFKDKYVIRDLKLSGVPSSLWLGKRRKVIAYRISPRELLKQLASSSNP